MEEPTRTIVRAIVLAVSALFLLPLQAQAERDWEFSAGVFGGKLSTRTKTWISISGITVGLRRMERYTV